MPGTPKLIILSEQLRGKSFELSNDLYTVGRVDERDICVKDPTISTYHCDFIKSGSTYVIRDNNSTNGTRVNNVPITEQELQNSDILQLGGVEILYDCDDKSVTTVMRTQTGINLENTDFGMATVKKLENFSPFERQAGSAGKSQKIVVAMVVVLVVVIVVLLAFLGYIIFKQQQTAAPGLVNFLSWTL